MMIAEGNQQRQNHQNVPPWSFFDDSTTDMGYDLTVGNGGSGGSSGFSGGGQYSPVLSGEALTELKRYLPSNDIESDSDISDSCDEFRMYEFKIRRCVGGRSHDWTDCPYAHPGEKARRRDPRIFHYSGTPCPDFRKGNCKRGDTCEYAHGVFECWLHPSRYRTQPCKDGTNCRRRICFFAHTPDQLRVLPKRSPKSVTESPPSYDGSPLRQAFDTYLSNGVSVLHSPTSTLISPPISPPDSPLTAHNSPILTRSIGSNSVNEVILSLRNLQLNKIKSAPSSWGVPINSGFFSPRGSSTLRPDFSSLPSTPTRTPSTRSGIGYLDFWDRCDPLEEEPAMEVVESGRNLRSKMYEKLSKENSLDRVESVTPVPDVEWIFELVK